MLETLPVLVSRRLETLKIEQAELWRRLGQANGGFVHQVMTGKKSLSPDAAAEWAKALELLPDTEEYRAFIYAASITTITVKPSTQAIASELLARLNAAEKDLAVSREDAALIRQQLLSTEAELTRLRELIRRLEGQGRQG